MPGYRALPPQLRFRRTQRNPSPPDVVTGEGACSITPTASGTGVHGVTATGAATLSNASASGTGVHGVTGTGAASVSPTASGTGTFGAQSGLKPVWPFRAVRRLTSYRGSIRALLRGEPELPLPKRVESKTSSRPPAPRRRMLAVEGRGAAVLALRATGRGISGSVRGVGRGVLRLAAAGTGDHDRELGLRRRDQRDIEELTELGVL